MPYFASTGYTDPIDNGAKAGLLVSGGAFAFTGIGGLRKRMPKGKGRKIPVRTMPNDSDSKQPEPISHADEAGKKLDHAAELARKMRDDLS